MIIRLLRLYFIKKNGIAENNKRNLFSLLVFLLILITSAHFGPLSAQQVFDSIARTAVIDILPDSSSLKINGSTNVNSFDCTYTGNIRNDSLLVKLILEDSSTTLRGAHLKLRVKHFDCGKNKMNEDFYDLMKANKSPFIYMDVALFKKDTEPETEHSPLLQSFDAETIFTLAGVTNTYQVDIEAKKQSKRKKKYPTTRIKGNHQLDITDFGLEPPTKFLGLVKVDKKVTISFVIEMKYRLKNPGE